MSRSQQITTPIANAHFMVKAMRNFAAEHRHTVSFLQRELSWGDTAVDLTAGDGVFAYWMARQVGQDQGKVYAVESTRTRVAYLKNLTTTLRLPQVHVVDASVGAVTGSKPGGRRSGSASEPERESRGGLSSVFGGGRSREERRRRKEAASGTHDGRGETTRDTAIDLPPSEDDFYRQLLTKKIPHPIRLLRLDMSTDALDLLKPAIDTLAEDGSIVLLTCDTRIQIDSCGDLFAWLRAQRFRGGFRFQNRDFPLSMFHPDRHRTATGRPFVRSFWFKHKDARERKAG
jgi:hypothetical protein